MSGEQIQAVADQAGETVLGTVTLMSDEPIEVPLEEGLRRRLQAQVRRRPWLIPAVLMTAVALLVASRPH